MERSEMTNPTPSSSGVEDAAPEARPQDNEAFELDEELDYNAAPPSYEEVVNSTRYPIVRSTTRNSGSSGHGWRLDFVDFTPHFNNIPGNKHVGNFRALLRRANTWLQSNPDVEVVTCETVTWTSTSAAQINDTNVVHRTRGLSQSVRTRYLRGFRIWFVPRGVEGLPACQINFEDFAPRDIEDSITSLLKKANKKLKDNPLAGKIVNLETVWCRAKPGKVYASSTYWTEAMTKPRQYCFFLRLFYLSSAPTTMVQIGIKDFLPSQTVDSYENFSHVTERSAAWVAEQTDIHVTNVQAVFVKKKGSPQNSHNKCFFTEHSLRADGRVTYFYQICRVAFTKSSAEVALVIQLPLVLTKKTFAPTMLPPTGEEREFRFESFTKTVERVGSWLDNTGADVFCVETVPVRVQTAQQQRQGPEATLVWSLAEPGVKVEDWLIFVRIYIKGEYQEPRMTQQLSLPPVDWYRHQSNRPIQRSATRRRNCMIFGLTLLFVVTGAFVIMYIAYSLVT